MHLISGEYFKNNYEIIDVKLSKRHKLDNLGFNVLLNLKNNLIITDVNSSSYCFNKLYNNDIVYKINNKDINDYKYDDIVKLILNCYNLKLSIIRQSEVKKNKNNENIYRVVGEEYLKISIFTKKYDHYNKCFKNDLHYLDTIFLNENLVYPKIIEDNDPNEVKKYLNENVFYDGYFSKYYVNYFETDILKEGLYLEDINNMTSYFFRSVSRIKSGIYINSNNYLWQVYLAELITTLNNELNNLGNPQDYKLKTIKQNYFPNYVANDASTIEKEYIKTVTINCDICESICAVNNT